MGYEAEFGDCEGRGRQTFFWELFSNIFHLHSDKRICSKTISDNRYVYGYIRTWYMVYLYCALRLCVRTRSRTPRSIQDKISRKPASFKTCTWLRSLCLWRQYILTILDVPGRYKYGNLALQVGGVSDETVKYGYRFWATRTIKWLHCKLQTRALVREGALQIQDRKFQTVTFRQEIISGRKSYKSARYLDILTDCQS
jgi:hypothetical protein